MTDLKRLQLIRDNLGLITAYLDGVHSQCTYGDGTTQQDMYLKLHNARHVIDVWVKELKAEEDKELMGNDR